MPLLYKNPISPKKKVDLVYNIPCATCDLSYVGHTKQPLETRLSQHKNSIKCAITSGVTKHVQDTGHSFNFQEVKPINFEYKLYRRLTAENVHILSRKTCNLKDDVFLNPSYASSNFSACLVLPVMQTLPDNK